MPNPPAATASAASHVTELPIISADATTSSEFGALASVIPPVPAPLKPPRVSFNRAAATGAPVQSEFYSSSSEQYYSEIKR